MLERFSPQRDVSPDNCHVFGVSEGLSLLFQVPPALMEALSFLRQLFDVLCVEIITSARRPWGPCGGLHRAPWLSNCSADFLWGLYKRHVTCFCQWAMWFPNAT